MGRRLSDRLLPWIAASLLLLAAIVALGAQVPDVGCGGEGTRDEGDETALAVVTVVATILAAAAGLFRLVAMAFADRFARRDWWVLGASLLLLAAATVVGGLVATAVGGLATGGLVLAVLALIALAAAAIAGKGVDGVGILLPVYLFAAAYVYLAVGLITLFAKSGIGC
jgi:MFS family permease